MKKTYTKPAVKKVKLVVDEAVLAGCKILPAAPGKTTRTCSNNACKNTAAS